MGSPPNLTPQNHQNEPAVAIDAHRPDVLVAGSIDYLDAAACPRNLATNTGQCENLDVPTGNGFAGVYFSFDRGRTWTQPTYTGWTARDCTAPDPCEGHVGPIGTLPWWYETGIYSSGDPAVAIGPRPVNGHFSWANGSRVYYANLAEKFKNRTILKSGAGVGVSRLDNPTPSRVRQKSSWMRPVILERNDPTSFRDKDQIWADNAASSRYFGHTYTCFNDYLIGEDESQAQVPLIVATSADGGDHWTEKVVARGMDPSFGHQGYIGCTVRTDSHGAVYLFAESYQQHDLSNLPTRGEHVVFTSFDGGKHWTKPHRLFSFTDECYFIDPLSGRCVMDGYTGARTENAAAPEVDIANGAPTGAGATNLIIDAWSDGSAGLNHEQVRASWSSDRGSHWHTPVAVGRPGDRPLYAAPALSPTGDRAYIAYAAVISPWRGSDVNSPRPYHGVFLSAPIAVNHHNYGRDDGPGRWTTVYNGPVADLRAGYPGHRLREERIGDYVYAAASRTYGVGVWIDMGNAAVCRPIQDWRGKSLAAGESVFPAPWPLADCPATFGNTNVWAATTG
ncbi:sialidase family protein [Streptomyces diastatochromogenes]|uniref:sialidase family protein n=1 Tax=Streptomyces diastatochromogenes TaxID=42236 RepID=UPI00117CC1E3|nr:sialidase family protein [Streptomyces diastatochromogenes]MCZ0985156.1 sialidase family protein [Streptomyces diastatochromogenes]